MCLIKKKFIHNCIPVTEIYVFVVYFDFLPSDIFFCLTIFLLLFVCILNTDMAGAGYISVPFQLINFVSYPSQGVPPGLRGQLPLPQLPRHHPVCGLPHRQAGRGPDRHQRLATTRHLRELWTAVARRGPPPAAGGAVSSLWRGGRGDKAEAAGCDGSPLQPKPLPLPAVGQVDGPDGVDGDVRPAPLGEDGEGPDELFSSFGHLSLWQPLELLYNKKFARFEFSWLGKAPWCYEMFVKLGCWEVAGIIIIMLWTNFYLSLCQYPMTCIYYGTSETIIPVITFKPKNWQRKKFMETLYIPIYLQIYRSI